MFDTFTALLGCLAIGALFGTIVRIIFRPPKVWDEDDWLPEQIEADADYNEIRRENPHIWMD